MTAGLPQEARDAFEGFITTEYTTTDSRQQPITWPVTPYYSPDAETVDVTTGIGYPKKANDARANPQVALLFSDPTGASKGGGAHVLVQGMADVDDRNLRANADRYARESAVKLPATADMHPPKLIQKAMAWYYARVYVKVRPERVFIWPEGDPAQAPDVYGAHMEEVRSGHSEEPSEPHAPPAGGRAEWDERLDLLGSEYPEAVLSWVAPDGFPLAVRIPVSSDQGSHRIAIDVTPAGLPIAEGRACVTAHRHGPNFEWQRNFQVRGDLTRDGDGWALVPHKLVGGFELPESRLQAMRVNARKSMRFAKVARKELKKRKARQAG